MKMNKKFTFWFLFMMTITTTLGSSLLISFNYVTFLSDNNPWLMILSWVIGGVFILPETLLMLEPAVSFKINGTAYGWLRRAGWKNVAFWFGWILVSMVAATAIASASISVGNIIAGLLAIENVWLTKFIGIGILLTLASLQLFVKNSGTILQVAFTILTIAPVILIILLAFIYGSFEYLNIESINQGLQQSYISSLLLIPAISFTMFAYSGLEVSTYVVEDAEKPEKTIPLVVILSIIAIVVIYLIYGVALVSLVKSTQVLGNPLVQVPFNLEIPEWTKITFNALAIFLFVGSINSYLVYNTKLVYKLSEEKDLSRHFLVKTKRTDIAWAAMLLLIGMAIFYILTNDLFNIILYFAFAVSALKMVMATCICYLRLKDPEYQKIYRNPTFYILLVGVYVSCGITLVGSILAMVKFGQSSQIWIPMTILCVVVAMYPLSYLKTYIQRKYFTYRVIKQK